jgi:hypothetical protein
MKRRALHWRSKSDGWAFTQLVSTIFDRWHLGGESERNWILRNVRPCSPNALIIELTMNTRYRYPLLISMMLLSQSLFAASTIQFPARTYTVNEAAGQAELPIVRVNDLDTIVSLEWTMRRPRARLKQVHTTLRQSEP